MHIGEEKLCVIERGRERVEIRERRRRKAPERKLTIVCPGALGTGRGVNSGSF